MRRTSLSCRSCCGDETSGTTAIVGGRDDDGGAGAAWVFVSGGTVWAQQSKLVGTGAVGGAFQGSSVALSGDGNTAIVGGWGDYYWAVGAAWVFTRSDGVWSQQGPKLVGTGAVGAAEQGSSVALSADGNTAIVGGQCDNTSPSFCPLGVGAAWIFTRSSGVWNQQGTKLVGTGAMGNSQQGTSVALSCNTALVGGPGDTSNAGAAWVFVVPPTATHDFNGGCRSDILWYNTTSASLAPSEIDGITKSAAMRMSASGTKRRFAAARVFGRYWG